LPLCISRNLESATSPPEKNHGLFFSIKEGTLDLKRTLDNGGTSPSKQEVSFLVHGIHLTTLSAKTTPRIHKWWNILLNHLDINNKLFIRSVLCINRILQLRRWKDQRCCCIVLRQQKLGPNWSAHNTNLRRWAHRWRRRSSFSVPPNAAAGRLKRQEGPALTWTSSSFSCLYPFLLLTTSLSSTKGFITGITLLCSRQQGNAQTDTHRT
jgi:hypothetical protein